MFPVQKKAIKWVDRQNWSTHKKKSVKGQILSLKPEDIPEFMESLK